MDENTQLKANGAAPISFSRFCIKRNRAYARSRYHRLAESYFDGVFFKHEGLNLDVLSEHPSVGDFEVLLRIDNRTGHVRFPEFYTPDLARPVKWKQTLVRAMVGTQLCELWFLSSMSLLTLWAGIKTARLKQRPHWAGTEAVLAACSSTNSLPVGMDPARFHEAVLNELLQVWYARQIKGDRIILFADEDELHPDPIDTANNPALNQILDRQTRVLQEQKGVRRPDLTALKELRRAAAY